MLGRLPNMELPAAVFTVMEQVQNMSVQHSVKIQCCWRQIM